jgi:spore germination protein
MRRTAGIAWLTVVVAGALLAVFMMLPGFGASARKPVVVGSLPYWNISHGAATVAAHRGDFTEVSPWMYGLARDGKINTQYPPRQAAQVSKAIAKLRAKGLRIVPTLANITANRWAYQPVARILHDPGLMKQHVAAITELVRQHGYAGVDIDYENLRAGDRQAFTRFITALSNSLHADGKVLSVAVFAKTSNAGVGPQNLAQDYAALGRVSDQVRVMAYDYHWAGSPPGPVAPVKWVRGVLHYAKSQISPHKIILGVPLYGYDWSRGHGTGITWLQALRLSRQHDAAAQYDTRAQAPWFSYTDAAGHRHVVWFENKSSSQAKFGAAAGSGIGGVYLWMFGYEDTGTWPALGHILPTAGLATGGGR